METTLEPREWVLQWLQRNLEASCVNTQFHDEFAAAFPKYRRIHKNWGAQPVPKAMEVLKELHSEGKLERRSISLGGNWQPGFPKFARSYSLPR